VYAIWDTFLIAKIISVVLPVRQFQRWIPCGLASAPNHLEDKKLWLKVIASSLDLCLKRPALGHGFGFESASLGLETRLNIIALIIQKQANNVTDETDEIQQLYMITFPIVSKLSIHWLI
jgi:hypothetical protein